MSSTIDKIDFSYLIYQNGHYSCSKDAFFDYYKFCNITITDENNKVRLRCVTCKLTETCKELFGIAGIPFLTDDELTELFERHPELKLIS